MDDPTILEHAVHATAVAIEGRAVLLLGPSKSGKSRLAAALVAASAARRTIELVGDDRVLLRRTAAGLDARPHPRVAGFIERRGLGLLAMPWRARAAVAGVVTLGTCPDGAAAAWLVPYPRLRLADVDPAARCTAVIAWWRERVATRDAKASRPLRRVG